jgi:hypothetical protein
MNSKCEMAKEKYCNKSFLGFCEAKDEDIEICPYPKAIEEIVRLSVINMDLENKFLDDGK